MCVTFVRMKDVWRKHGKKSIYVINVISNTTLQFSLLQRSHVVLTLSGPLHFTSSYWETITTPVWKIKSYSGVSYNKVTIQINVVKNQIICNAERNSLHIIRRNFEKRACKVNLVLLQFFVGQQTIVNECLS